MMINKNPRRGDLKLAAVLPVYMPPELKDLIAAAADRENLPMSEFVVKALADRCKRPDLAKVPRKRPGRPRKETAQAS